MHWNQWKQYTEWQLKITQHYLARHFLSCIYLNPNQLVQSVALHNKSNMKAYQAIISPNVACRQEPISFGGNNYLHKITGIQGSHLNAIIHLVHGYGRK